MLNVTKQETTQVKNNGSVAIVQSARESALSVFQCPKSEAPTLPSEQVVQSSKRQTNPRFKAPNKSKVQSAKRQVQNRQSQIRSPKKQQVSQG